MQKVWGYKDKGDLIFLESCSQSNGSAWRTACICTKYSDAEMADTLGAGTELTDTVRKCPSSTINCTHMIRTEQAVQIKQSI